MSCSVTGAYTWELVRNRSWGKEYKLTSLVRSSSATYSDGPNAAINATGLPQPGDSWSVKGDIDTDAYCLPDATVKPYEQKDGEPHQFFVVEQTFSTDKSQVGSCKTTEEDNPLLQPAKVSGTFNRYTEEATVDRFGRQLINSAFEQIRGPQVEFDRNRPSVKIEQNVASLDLPLIAQMVDTVNAYSIWGLPVRTVKLSNAPWEAKFYGQCLKYYTRTLEFDINYSTWDRIVLDEGTKVLNGHWDAETTGKWVLDNIPGTNTAPNPANPAHFIKAIDRQGNPMHVILDGAGKPFDPSDATDAKWWCLLGQSVDGTLQDQAVCLNATCEGAHTELDSRNRTQRNYAWFLYGPYTTQAGCEDTCDNTPVLGEESWLSLNLPSDAAPCSYAGRRLIQKYDESDFVLLGIPLDF